MFRASFIYLSQAAWAKQLVSNWSVARGAASRFVAGEKLDDALEAVRRLNQDGFNTTLDHLGEHTTTDQKAHKATKDIIDILDAIENSKNRASVSIKLTQIGLAIDNNLCETNLEKILSHARQKGNFVRIDMEDSPWIDNTLELFWKMRNDHNHYNVGLVIQSYLYRSIEDVVNLMSSGGKVRLCKGAYKEPKELAYPKKPDVDVNFDRITKLLIDRALQLGAEEVSEDGKIPPLCAIASHDQDRLEFAKDYAREVGLSKSALEFQMLYGIRRELQNQYLDEGYPVRIYIPYGTEWYPYFTRRLAERPANLWFFISNFFRN
jgi:proline dehydrogenase